jgi:hypothetical protein
MFLAGEHVRAQCKFLPHTLRRHEQMLTHLLKGPGQNKLCTRVADHPRQLRCSSVEYSRVFSLLPPRALLARRSNTLVVAYFILTRALRTTKPLAAPLGASAEVRRCRLRCRTQLSRCSSSIETFSGPRTNAMRTPGRIVVVSMVKSTPFAFSSATVVSISATRRPMWSRP